MILLESTQLNSKLATLCVFGVLPLWSDAGLEHLNGTNLIFSSVVAESIVTKKKS